MASDFQMITNIFALINCLLPAGDVQYHVMNNNITLEHVRAALALTDFDVDAARARMRPILSNPRAYNDTYSPPEDLRFAGVLALLYPGIDDALSVVLMKRTVHEHDRHSGQVSFPGGSQERGEQLAQTALRETFEELGVPPEAVELLGRLRWLQTFDFRIHPFVGYTAARPDWHPGYDEVARVLEMPLSALLDDAVKALEEWPSEWGAMRVPFYRWDGEPVWGATGMMLSELEWRLRAALRE
jgi:8-oxo-dGTP pyrophosphatase MutT (NUDIX family)